MPVIDEYLKEVLSKKGSDLHFLAGDPPRLRLYGDLQPLRPDRLEKDFVQQTLYEIMPKTAVKRFEEHDGADFAYNMGEYGRFRVNVMRQLNGMVAAKDNKNTPTNKRFMFVASIPSSSLNVRYRGRMQFERQLDWHADCIAGRCCS